MTKYDTTVHITLYNTNKKLQPIFFFQFNRLNKHDTQIMYTYRIEIITIQPR